MFEFSRGRGKGLLEELLSLRITEFLYLLKIDAGAEVN